MDKVIELAVSLALIASATHQLPKIIRQVQIAQLKLLEESKTSTWGHLMIIDTRGNHSKSR